MNIHPQCIECIQNAAFRTLELMDIPSEKKKIVLEKIDLYLRETNLDLTPMEISFGTNEIIQRETGTQDPLKKIKEELKD